jgi:hypothetical protein
MTASSTDAAHPRTLRLRLEPVVRRGSPDPTEDEIVAYYAEHVPPDGPPLSQVREHVVAALTAAARASRAEADPLEDTASALDLHLLVTLRDDLRRLHRAHAIEGGVSEHPQRWFGSAQAEAAFTDLAAAVAARPTGPHGRVLFAPDDVRAELMETLERTAAILRAAAAAGRRFRLEPARRTIPVRVQLQVLARAGIELYDGTPAWEQLFWQFEEDELAADPWYRLHHVFERASGYVVLASKGADPIDDCYRRVVECVRSVCRGSLPLTQVHSTYRPDEDVHEVTATLDDRSHRFRAEPHGRWIDPRLFAWLASLVKARGQHRLCTLEYRPSLGDELPLFCCERSEISRLRAASMPVVEVNGRPRHS